MRLHVYRSDVQAGRARWSHAVRYLGDEEALLRTVAELFLRGLKRGDAVVACVSEDRWRALGELLRGAGVEPEKEMRRGALRRMDPRVQIDSVLEQGMPSPERFDAVVGAAIRAAQESVPSSSVLAYTEDLDLLCLEGRFEAARRLEDLWVSLVRESRHAFVCTQRLDVFQALTDGLPTSALAQPGGVCLFDSDRVRLDAALRDALAETLGPAAAESLLRFASLTEPPPGLPPGPEHALFWIRDNLPACSREIIRRAQTHFHAGPEANCPPECFVVDAPEPFPILLVEDDANDLFLFEYTCKRFAPHLEIRTARDGDAAWTLLTRRLDLPRHIILDLKLPRKSGLELLGDLKAHPDLRNIPVTIHTSSRELSDVARAYELGAASYIVKQQDMSDLARGLAMLASIVRM